MKIVTFTPNPAIDLTIGLEKLTPGEVHRAATSSIRAGGKGINVSANIAGYGMDTIASGFLGSGNAEIFERYFSDMNITDGFLRVEGENRTNIKIVDTTGTTDINLKSISVSAWDLKKLMLMAESFFSGESGIAVLSGSLPTGCPPDFYRALIGKLKALHCAVLLDADGAALKSSLAADVLPDCIKPNIRELSEWAGQPLKSHGDIIRVARKLLERGLQLVVVSMGGDGALFVNSEQVLYAWGKAERIASTVGAGDAMMAGIASAWALDPKDSGARLEGIAKISTAFAISWLESNAAGEQILKGKTGLREKVETAMRKVIVKNRD
jgi:1-phosphofructokinase